MKDIENINMFKQKYYIKIKNTVLYIYIYIYNLLKLYYSIYI